MKAQVPEEPATTLEAKKQDFWKSLRCTGAWALGAALLVDAFYFFVFPGDGLPGKLGWLLLIVPNLFFAFGIAALTLFVWRNAGGGWPLQPYIGKRNLINGFILGLLFTCVVAGAVFTLFMACSGAHVADAFVAFKDALLAQPGESLYIGVKVIGVSVAAEGGGKVEDQPPR